MNDQTGHAHIFEECEELKNFDPDHPLKKLEALGRRSLMESGQLHNRLMRANYAMNPNEVVNQALTSALRAFVEIGKGINEQLKRHIRYDKHDMPAQTDQTLANFLSHLAYQLSEAKIGTAKNPNAVIEQVREDLFTLAQRCAYGGENDRPVRGNTGGK